MNTFLPYSDFDKSAQVLDSKRLVKQNLETRQILNTLCGFSEGWRNHPAVLQWKGCIRALIYYGLAINEECIKRGFKNSENQHRKYLDYCIENKLNEEYPKWLGDEAIHSSHRSRLICKGLIDVYCDALKRKLKFKKIDIFIKEHFNKTKNALKWEDVPLLEKLIKNFNAQEFVKPNFYNKFGWTDDPSKPYIWPKKT